MTNPVILLGTQSNGETLPVQVDAFGRLVAEGLQGTEGPEGPEGPQGPEGPPGQNGIELPPDPYEGALLGWLNNELAWVGAPPVPIPEGLFGPIVSWNTNGVLVVEGPIPQEIGNGVYLEQVNIEGNPVRPDLSWDISTVWSDGCDGADPPKAFNNDDSNSCGMPNTWCSLFTGAKYGSSISINQNYWGSGPYQIRVNGGQPIQISVTGQGWQWGTFDLPQRTLIQTVEIQATANDNPGIHWSLKAVKVDDDTLIDPEYGVLIGRVNQVVDETTLLVANSTEGDFIPGQYLKIQEQRVAPWVLYGNDPTSLIDHLRSS